MEALQLTPLGETFSAKARF